MSTYTDALHEFVQASFEVAGIKWSMPDVAAEDRADRRLAQAGDVLERETRSMMREEAHRVADGLSAGRSDL